MNNTEDKKLEIQDAENVRDISKWSRRYAENRTLTVLVFMAMIVVYSIFVGGLFGFLLPLAARGFLKGKVILGCIATVILVIALAAIVKFHFIIFKKFGGKNKGLLDKILDRWIYGKEGAASMPMPKLSKKKKYFDISFGIVSAILTIGTMELGILGYISVKYFLPFTALFVIPFGVYQYFIMRPRIGALLLIFPLLYAIHAILILAGVPIFFTGTFAIALNLLVPIAYMFLTYLLGHFYSRYALRKLKNAAKVNDGGVDGV